MAQELRASLGNEDLISRKQDREERGEGEEKREGREEGRQGDTCSLENESINSVTGYFKF